MKTKVDKVMEITDNSRDYLQAIYLDYVNNFLAIDCFAKAYGMDNINASTLVGIAKRVHEQRTKNS